ncbi:hypothetical protein DSO57_1038324 [Entomophthora muscae]|uniref:Uncharacterized protein n=1 Tax=Entomophthora muscae TaxID=34485 RepID=A0ACC2RPU0_9FUNG|nr:hypothetical protein DSO57_1038324 [Entomophthora muscae]
MMAKEDYKKEKCALSSSASPNPINKKPNSDCFVDPNVPHFDTKSNQFPFKLFNKRFIHSRGLSPDHVITPPPMKRADCEDAPHLKTLQRALTHCLLLMNPPVHHHHHPYHALLFRTVVGTQSTPTLLQYWIWLNLNTYLQ